MRNERVWLDSEWNVGLGVLSEVSINSDLESETGIGKGKAILEPKLNESCFVVCVDLNRIETEWNLTDQKVEGVGMNR